MKTLVLVPAYNVEKEIPLVLSYIKDNGFESIIINDGSTDNTRSIIEKYGLPHINLPENTGVSNAIINGIEYALDKNYTHVIMIDSDGQHIPNDIERFAQQLKTFNYVFGNRFHSTVNIPSCKLAANSMISALYRELFSSWIPDISCGYKGYVISDHLVESLRKDDQYSVVYSIVNYALKHNQEYTMLSTRPIYYQSDFLSTKRVEIMSFWNSLSRYFEDKIYRFNFIKEAVEKRMDFDVVLCGIHYYAYYVDRNDSYIFQADVGMMSQLY